MVELGVLNSCGREFESRRERQMNLKRKITRILKENSFASDTISVRGNNPIQACVTSSTCLDPDEKSDMLIQRLKEEISSEDMCKIVLMLTTHPLSKK